MGILKRTKPKVIESHWDIITLSEKNCFVCDKHFHKGEKTICVGKKDGVELHRHYHCDANSIKWGKKFKNCKTLQIF